MENEIISTSQYLLSISICIWHKILKPKIDYLKYSCRLHILDKSLIQGESPCFGFIPIFKIMHLIH